MDKPICPLCNGTGQNPDPEAWTHDLARQNPEAFNAWYAKEMGVDAILPPSAVAPSYFINGKLKCTPCKGSGRIEPGQKVEVPKPQGVEIIQYSDRAIAVRGETYPIRQELTALRGKFIKYLKEPDGSGKRFAGWIFPATRENEVRQALKL